ncbi:MAG: AAA family ATPase [Proteobacteria bacterium]|nr:AAA family ATPase [Pseudomonadota bacterium]
MSRPLAAGDLWDKVRKDHSEKSVVIISADDLRAGGVNICRCLSWERTAKDFIWQMASNPDLLPLVYSANLVVRFGLEGAIHYMHKGNRVESRLYFDPLTIEDSFKEKYPGEMQGLSSVFTAALAASIAGSNAGGDISEAVSEGIRDGILASRRLFRYGYGNNVDQPFPKILEPQENEHDNIADIIIPNPTGSQLADPNFWCILKEIKSTMLEDIAYDIVRNGETAALKYVPVGNFGKLKTVDRAEIESFQSIKNLIHEYVNSQRSARPLSIAVFGPPGSGKSFAVTEVAKSIAPGQVVRLEFNVSQFRSPSDLINAFHRVRDCALKGLIPLVFFDEFDSPFEGKLGWLKYFLSPMQDGSFRDNESVHPIGRSIFVFAGGTNNTFQDFSVDDKESAFKNAKGPDFLSRLRGYVNILGPNPANPDDTVFVIRRAMLLRSLLERTAKQLFDNNNRAGIDEGVLRALIKVPEYKHGARSMEAIIEMSMLTEQSVWEQAYLPAKQQLMLHVDEEIFSNLVSRNVILGAAREELARAIHEKYLEDQKNNKPASDPSMQPWETLNENLKESNRRQADHIPEKLRKVDCGFAPVVNKEPAIFEFTPQEIEILAENEHERWVSERQLDGWVLGEKKDVEKKISLYLIPWSDLTEDEKELDRQAMRNLSNLLAKAKFEIYRMH